ncbi:hypothetical protein [Nostoc sp.]
MREIEVHPNLWLAVVNYEHNDNLLIKVPDGDHPLEFSVFFEME